jgi:hypothetical protein
MNQQKSVLCPGCSKEAKKSFGLDNTYVCRCLGFLEDIRLINNKNNPQTQLFSKYDLKQIYGTGTLDSNLIKLDDLSTYILKISPKLDTANFRFRMSVLKRKEAPFSVFYAKNDGFDFVIVVNDLKLIQDGRYIFHNGTIGFKAHIISAFEPIKKELIKNGKLDTILFEPTTGRKYTSAYNDYWTKP